jgi:hypothetical protein
MQLQDLLIGLVNILAAAKLGGELMERLGPTAVLVGAIGRLQARGALAVSALVFALAAVAIGSKLAAGLAVYHPDTRRCPVGVGMAWCRAGRSV